MTDTSYKQWYARYPRKYQEKTSRLSLAEHGAYTMLLDHYYLTESPLPANQVQLQRICRSIGDDEARAIATVIDSFFDLTPRGYVNDTAEEEIAKRRSISQKRSKSANIRHSPRDTKANSGDANAPAYASAKAHALANTDTLTVTNNAALPANVVSDDQVDHLCNIAGVRPEITDNRLINSWLSAGLSLQQIERALKLRRDRMDEPPKTLRFYDGAVKDALKPAKSLTAAKPPRTPKPDMASRQAAVMRLEIPDA